MKNLSIKKLYYSISEVSEMTSVKPYVLRYWETEFPDLRPSKNRAGNRIYRNNDIKLIYVIKKLLYNEKYTIEGAKQKIKKIYRGGNGQLDLTLDQERRKELIGDIRKGLLEIQELLNEENRGVAQSG